MRNWLIVVLWVPSWDFHCAPIVVLEWWSHWFWLFQRLVLERLHHLNKWYYSDWILASAVNVLTCGIKASKEQNKLNLLNAQYRSSKHGSPIQYKQASILTRWASPYESFRCQKHGPHLRRIFHENLKRRSIGFWCAFDLHLTNERVHESKLIYSWRILQEPKKIIENQVF